MLRAGKFPIRQTRPGHWIENIILDEKMTRVEVLGVKHSSLYSKFTFDRNRNYNQPWKYMLHLSDLRFLRFLSERT